MKPPSASSSIRVSLNTGLGAFAHVGQNEFEAGQAVGRRFSDEGAKHLVCVIHVAGNIGLEDRCRGVKDTFTGTVDNVQVDIANIVDAGNTIQSTLLSDTSIDGVVTLGAQIAIAARQARDDAGSSAVIGTFDMSEDVLDAVSAGTILFAVDQQPYLQGYMPVVMLELYISNGNILGGGELVRTGPNFITKDDAAQVLEFAKNGTR